MWLSMGILSLLCAIVDTKFYISEEMSTCKIVHIAVSVYTAGSYIPSTAPTTTLRVSEVTQSSARLDWIPLPGATGYILRWRDETGETCYYAY